MAAAAAAEEEARVRGPPVAWMVTACVAALSAAADLSPDCVMYILSTSAEQF